MNTKRKVAPLIATIIIVGSLSGGAIAQTVIGPFSDSVINNSATPTGVINEYQLTGFDSSLGTLTGVTLTYKADIKQSLATEITNGSVTPTSDGFISNLNAVAGRGLLQLGVDSTGGVGFDNNSQPTSIWSDPNIFLIGNTASTTVGALFGSTGITVTADGNIDFAGSSGDSSGLQTVISINQTQNLTDASDLAFFQDSIVSIFDYQAGRSSAMGPGNVANFVQTIGNGEVSVLYSFTPVPEPSSTALLGLGGFGLLLRRKR